MVTKIRYTSNGTVRRLWATPRWACRWHNARDSTDVAVHSYNLIWHRSEAADAGFRCCCCCRGDGRWDRRTARILENSDYAMPPTQWRRPGALSVAACCTVSPDSVLDVVCVAWADGNWSHGKIYSALALAWARWAAHRRGSLVRRGLHSFPIALHATRRALAPAPWNRAAHLFAICHRRNRSPLRTVPGAAAGIRDAVGRCAKNALTKAADAKTCRCSLKIKCNILCVYNYTVLYIYCIAWELLTQILSVTAHWVIMFNGTVEMQILKIHICL